MKAFRFDLQSVLRHRQMKEDQARRDFLWVKGLFDQRRDALDRLFDVRRRTRDEMGTKTGGAVEVKELLRYQRYLNGLRYQIATARAELATVEKELDARRQLFEKARRERKVMDKLRERRREDWAVEVRRAEQKETDEVGAQLTSRRKDGRP